MLERMTVRLSTEEREALERLAQTEVRDFRDQARHIIRVELERLGFIKLVTNSDQEEITNNFQDE